MGRLAFPRVEARLFGGAPVPGDMRAAQPGQQGGNVSVAVEEEAVTGSSCTALRSGEARRWTSASARCRPERQPLCAGPRPRPPSRRGGPRSRAPRGRRRNCRPLSRASPAEGLPDVLEMLLQRGTVAEEAVHVNHHGPMERSTRAGTPEAGEPDAGPAAPGSEIACWRPRGKAAFMMRMRTDDAPCRPSGIIFLANWPSRERKLVLHLPQSHLMVALCEIELGEPAGATRLV